MKFQLLIFIEVICGLPIPVDNSLSRGVIGFGKFFTDTITGTTEMIAHPIQTIKSGYNTLKHPVNATKTLVKKIKIKCSVDLAGCMGYLGAMTTTLLLPGMMRTKSSVTGDIATVNTDGAAVRNINHLDSLPERNILEQDPRPAFKVEEQAPPANPNTLERQAETHVGDSETPEIFYDAEEQFNVPSDLKHDTSSDINAKKTKQNNEPTQSHVDGSEPQDKYFDAQEQLPEPRPDTSNAINAGRTDVLSKVKPETSQSVNAGRTDVLSENNILKQDPQPAIKVEEQAIPETPNETPTTFDGDNFYEPNGDIHDTLERQTEVPEQNHADGSETPDEFFDANEEFAI